MKRSADQQQPSTSGVGAQLQKRGRLTVEQARLALECDLDVSDEEGLDEDSDYPGSDLETESEDDSEGVDIDTNLGGRGHRGGGDNIGVNFQAGWNRTFTAVDSTFDESVCGPQNMPDSIGMDSSPLDFLSLFLDDAFWTNLVTESRTDVPQRMENVGMHYPEAPEGVSRDHVCVVCEEKHNKYKKSHLGVAYKDNAYKKVKTTFWCGFCKRYLCLKKGNTCWQDWHNKLEYWK